MRSYHQLVDMDEHAALWTDLSVLTRVVDDMEDITVGRHPALGLCVVTHYALEPLIAWTTRTPIPDELTD